MNYPEEYKSNEDKYGSLEHIYNDEDSFGEFPTLTEIGGYNDEEEMTVTHHHFGIRSECEGEDLSVCEGEDPSVCEGEDPSVCEGEEPSEYEGEEPSECEVPNEMSVSEEEDSSREDMDSETSHSINNKRKSRRCPKGKRIVRWNAEEGRKLLRGIKSLEDVWKNKQGKGFKRGFWKTVAPEVGTKTPQQCKSHYQKVQKEDSSNKKKLLISILTNIKERVHQHDGSRYLRKYKINNEILRNGIEFMLKEIETNKTLNKQLDMKYAQLPLLSC